MATLSAAYAADAAGAPLTSSASAELAINLAPISQRELAIGFLQPTLAATPLDAARLRISVEESTLVDLTFDSPAAISAYFLDQVVDLGDYAGVDGVLDLRVTLDVTASTPGARLVAPMIIGNTTLAPPLGDDADFNGDGVVGPADLATWRSHFGMIFASAPDGDANHDNSAAGDDFLVWQRQLGPGAGQNAVPEPAAVVLALMVLAWPPKARQAAGDATATPP
jgi:hypothetical protein